ncbi:MAG: hypothetical protein EZS28_012455 [Streblomastix strix]|uniref:Uncharacterized protein n=1 Tax=Streblomastix strix TaxID=222440 RepID=A0A5J4WAN8_9EUKA|nr:MAG: hypothetical protein EZS28_012455 [Streblomastix strix]
MFRLLHAGAGGRTIPSLKKHIMKREIRYIDHQKNNQNLCFFLAYSFITIPNIKADVAADGSAIAAKCYMENSRIAEVKRLFKRLFKEARIIINSNNYEDETIPQHYEVPVIVFNSSKRRLSLFFFIFMICNVRNVVNGEQLRDSTFVNVQQDTFRYFFTYMEILLYPRTVTFGFGPFFFGS